VETDRYLASRPVRQGTACFTPVVSGFSPPRGRFVDTTETLRSKFVPISYFIIGHCKSAKIHPEPLKDSAPARRTRRPQEVRRAARVPAATCLAQLARPRKAEESQRVPATALQQWLGLRSNKVVALDFDSFSLLCGRRGGCGRGLARCWRQPPLAPLRWHPRTGGKIG
jgi:hypothetical protein